VLAGFGHGGVGMFSYLDDDGGKKKKVCMMEYEREKREENCDAEDG
jgi:hypothetical protein